MFSSPKYSKSTGFIPPPAPDGIIGEYIPLHKRPLTALPTRKLPSLPDKTIDLFFQPNFFPYTSQIINELTLFPSSDQKIFWGQNNFVGLKHLRLKFFQSKIFFGLKFFQTKNYCS